MSLATVLLLFFQTSQLFVMALQHDFAHLMVNFISTIRTCRRLSILFAGVDPISVGDIRNLVSDLKKRGIGVLITDHNVRETLEIVDRAYILHNGKVLMSGTPNDVVENENVRRVYLGENFRIS
jgi:ABC-type uncharacterized transport system ATPase subunit